MKIKTVEFDIIAMGMINVITDKYPKAKNQREVFCWFMAFEAVIHDLLDEELISKDEAEILSFLNNQLCDDRMEEVSESDK